MRFVLVHGAWHGGWCWHKLTAELERRGHEVAAPDLPGHGVDRTPVADVSLDAYAGRVVEALRASDTPAVLVGHSMGGLVITEAAERASEMISRLVYLCAFMRPPGASPGDDQSVMASSDVPSAVVPTQDGQTTSIDPSRLRDVFYADCSDEDIVLARACLVPQRMDLFGAPLTNSQARWGGIARDFIVCTQDRAIPEAGQRLMIEETGCNRVIELNASHSPFFSQPTELADALTAAP